MTTAGEILTALQHHHAMAAFVPEVVMRDPYWLPGDTDATVKPHRRIDALMFRSYVRTAIEIKVDRADISRDHPRKWGPWAQVCHRFVYAVPAGLADQGDIVRKTGNYAAGVWLVHPDGRVEVARQAKVQKVPEPLPQQVIQNLAYRIHNTTHHHLED